MVFLIFHFVISFYVIANINAVINLMPQIKHLKIFSLFYNACISIMIFRLIYVLEVLISVIEASEYMLSSMLLQKLLTLVGQASFKIELIRLSSFGWLQIPSVTVSE